MQKKEYIERNKMIDRIQELKDNLRNKILGMTQVIASCESIFRMGGEACAISNCENIILTIPTADVRENITGHWIELPAGEYCRYECSVCGHASVSIAECNFCPNCGADMRDENDAK